MRRKKSYKEKNTKNRDIFILEEKKTREDINRKLVERRCSDE